MPTNFSTLSLIEISREIDAISRDAEATFGGLTAVQLNWKSTPSRWSIAQCFDHLIRINGQMLDGIVRTLDPATPKTLVQRVPGLPRVFGRIMIRSLSPTATRKLAAPASAHPSTSDLGGDIIVRFVEAQASMRERLRSFDDRALAATTMVLPVRVGGRLQHPRRMPDHRRARAPALRAGAAGHTDARVPRRTGNGERGT